MSNSVDSIKNIINGFSVQRDVPLYELTSFRIGGPASYVWEVSDPDSLCKLTDLARLHKIPFVLLGRGTNVLADDKGYSGLLIRFDRPLHPPVFSGETVRACAGTSLTQLDGDGMSLRNSRIRRRRMRDERRRLRRGDCTNSEAGSRV